MDTNAFTKEKLDEMPKDVLVTLYLQLTEQYSVILKQNEELLHKVDNLQEQLLILVQNRFGRKSEKNLAIPGQLTLADEYADVFNEAEVLADTGNPSEPLIEEVVVRRKSRSKGVRESNLEHLETQVIEHSLDEETLKKHFPHGWHELADEVHKDLVIIPMRLQVNEHHVKIYAGNRDEEGILRAPAPKRLLDHSILTPELGAFIINTKYVNAVPLNRLSEEFLRGDAKIARQDMAGWMIRLYQYYLLPIRQMMKETMLRGHHIHCDETPFVMPGKAKQYMWLYHSPADENTPSIFLYEYPGTRGSAAPREFLKGYSGYAVTDGYQVYHILARESAGELKVAGCWAHARRRFAEIVKVAGKAGPQTIGQKVAAEAVERIAAIYHVDDMNEGESAKDRLEHRKRVVKPLVDAYFAWVKEKAAAPGLDPSSKLAAALNYSVNQEEFLRTFLTDGRLPLDNNDAERSIRAFCVGKKNWHIIDSKSGAEASAFLYSLAETAKANNLKTYPYFAYLLHQLKEYPRGNVPRDVLEALMPWSDKLPDICRKNLE